MSFYREMNSKFGKIYLLATMKYLVWKVTVTHEQFSRTSCCKCGTGENVLVSWRGKIVFLPYGFKFDIATQTNE